jgi:carbon storage regulator CsrA
MRFEQLLRDEHPVGRTLIREVKEMLVLSRKEGEQLIIGDDVVITVSRISGNRVALGIEAPRNIRIVRGELERREDSGGVATSAASLESTHFSVASRPVG